MALRYFKQQEQSYVPTYTPIQPELMSRTHQQIQAQGAKAMQHRRDTFDVAAENVTNTLSNLDDRDQQYAREQFAKSRKKMQDLVKEKGARNLMPFVDEEVNRLTRELQPLQEAAKTKEQAIKSLQENKELPTTIKQAVLDQEIGGRYDEEGNLVGMKGGFNQKDLSVAKNWQDWTSDIQSFVTNMNASEQESAQFQTSPDGTAKYRKKLKSLGFDQVSAGVVNFLMSDPQYREQLELLGKTELGEIQSTYENLNKRRKRQGLDPIESPISMNDRGQVIAEMERYITDKNGNRIKAGTDEEGNPIYRREQVTKKFDSLAEYKASELGATYGQQGFFELSYTDTRETGEESDKDDKLINRFITGREGLPREEKDFSSYMQGVQENAKTYNNRYENLKSDVGGHVDALFPEDDADYSVTEEGDLSIKIRGTAYTLDQLRETGKLGEQQYQKMLNIETAMKSAKNQANTFEKEIDTAKESIKNQLAQRYPEQEQFIISNVEVSDNGTIDIKEPESQPENVEAWKGQPMYQPDFKTNNNPDLKKFLRSNSKNAIMKIKETYPDPTTEAPEKLVYVSKGKDGKPEYFNLKNEFKDSFREIAKSTMDRVTGAGHHDTATLLLNPEDKSVDEDIIATVKNQLDFGTALGEGNVIDSEGNQVTFDMDENMRFNPQEIGIGKDGQAFMKGTAHNVDGGDRKSVYWTGDTVTNLLKRKLGDTYQKVIADRAVDNILPKVFDKGSTKLSSQELINMGASVYKDGEMQTLDDVEITVRKRMRDGVPTSDFYVTIPGHNKQPFIYHTKDQLARALREKSVKLLTKE